MSLFKKILSYFKHNQVEEKEELVVKEPVIEYIAPIDEYNKIKIGDLVWAMMPLSADELSMIEESHRIRPYLVVAKDDNDIYGYYCSSKKKSRYLAYYKLDKNIYNHRKNTYIYLTKTYRIPRANFKSIFDTVSNNQLMMIERKLRVNSRYLRGLIHFDIDIVNQIGDIIKINQQLYYIYQSDSTNLYTYKTKFVRENKIRYEFDFNQSYIFKTKASYELVNTLSPKNINLIIEQKKQFKRLNKNKQRNKHENSFCYPRGSIFEDYNGDKIIYLYSRGIHHYGINIKINEFFPYISDINNIDKANIIGEINDGKMLIMLERLLDQNINPHNVVTMVYQDLMKQR